MRFFFINSGALYKFRQWVAGNKFPAIGIIVVVLAAIVSVATLSVSFARERRLQQETAAARAKTEVALVRSQQTERFLEGMLRDVGPADAQHRSPPTLQEILDRAASRTSRELTNQPAAGAEILSLIGQAYQELGEYDQAETMHRSACALNQKLYGLESPEAAASLNDLGLTLWNEGNLAESEVALVDALSIRRQLFGNLNPDVAVSLNNLARVYRGQRRLEEAEKLLRESLGTRRKLFGNESPEVETSLYDLAILLGDEGKHPESETTAREVQAIRQKLIKNEDASARSTADETPWPAELTGQPDGSKSLVLTALAIQREVLGDTNPAVAKTLSSYGEMLREQGNLAESEVLLNGALSVQLKLLGENNPDILDTLRSLAKTLEGEGKWAEAEVSEREALSLWRKRTGNENPEMTKELEDFVDALVAQKKLDEAEQLLDESLTPEFIGHPSSANLLERRVDIRGRRGRWEEAASDAALAVERNPDDPYRYHVLAVLLAANHDRSEYQRLCQKMLTSFAGTTEAFADERMAADCLLLPDSGVDLQLVNRLADRAVTAAKGDDFALPLFQPCMAISQYRLGHYASAIAWVEHSQTNSTAYEQAEDCATLAMAHWQLGQKDEAQAALAKGIKLTAGVFSGHDNEDMGADWVLWLIARTQLDEATDLIEPARTDGGDSLQP